MSDPVRDAGRDDWLDAVASGEPFYLACPEGHGWLPPRQICPTCGSRELESDPLSLPGHVATYSTVQVATPQFEDDAPYVTAIADFGPVSATGLVRGVDPADVAEGTPVAIEVGERETTGDRVVVFRPE